MLNSLRWVRESPNDHVQELVAVVQYNALRHEQSAAVPGFCCTDNGVIYEFGPQHICQGLRASLADSDNVSKDGLVKKLVAFLFRNCIVAVALVNGGRFAKIILELNCRKTEPSFENTTTRNTFEVIIFFHRLSVFNYRIQNTTLTVF